MTLTNASPLIGGISEHDRELEALDRLLRGELSAVETYSLAIENIGEDLQPDLRRLRESHRVRSEQIHNHIALLGGEPSETSGVWGAFARLVEGGATMFGERRTLEALELGELHGVREYRDVSDLAPETRTFVRSHLRPEQERTYAALGELIRHADAA